MSDRRKQYLDKLCSPEEAVKPISSGQRVFIGSNAAEPKSLVEAMAAHAEAGADINVVHILTLGSAPYASDRYTGHIRANALFIGANVREAVNEGRADYTPIFLSEIPDLFRSGRLPIDHALVCLSPPDAHGFCSLGVSVDVVRAAIDNGARVIAEINPNMPRTLGDSFIHLSQISCIVESSQPLPELAPPEQNEVTRRIGRYIADLIEDGSTLQMGIGAIPDAVLASLDDRHDLGIHTEMLSDGIIGLYKKGVITGKRKTIHPGKIITSFCMGTRDLYDFVNDNPIVEFYPTEYVNDPFRIAQHDNMVAINAAIEVDITGQVCADSVGSRFYSGIGGQVDFLRGAARSKGGKPVVALPSTAHLRDGRTTSRIVNMLQPGAGVVTSRGDVHYIVTEWGVAYLHGRSIRERALALIQIAHPDFRSELLKSAIERKLIPSDFSEQDLTPQYPQALEFETELNGEKITVRPIRPTDEELMREFHYRLSDETVCRRYGYPLRSLPQRDRVKLVTVDYQRELALVAVRQEGPREEMIAVVRWLLNPGTGLAQLLFTVRDDWQGKGVGSLLMSRIIEAGRERRLKGFDAFLDGDNSSMVKLLEKYGFHPSLQPDGTRIYYSKSLKGLETSHNIRGEWIVAERRTVCCRSLME